MGRVDELQVLSDEIKVGDPVNVKMSVATPRFGWGPVTHAHVGIV